MEEGEVEGGGETQRGGLGVVKSGGAPMGGEVGAREGAKFEAEGYIEILIEEPRYIGFLNGCCGHGRFHPQLATNSY